MPNPAKDQKREEKVLAKLPEICLGLPQAREVKTWRPTCRRSRVTKRRGAKARRQCRQGLRLPGKNSFRRPIRGWLRYPGGGQTSTNQVKEYKVYVTSDTVLKLEDQDMVFSDMHVGDRIIVSGIPKGSGNDLEATSIKRKF